MKIRVGVSVHCLTAHKAVNSFAEHQYLALLWKRKGICMLCQMHMYSWKIYLNIANLLMFEYQLSTLFQSKPESSNTILFRSFMPITKATCGVQHQEIFFLASWNIYVFEKLHRNSILSTCLFLYEIYFFTERVSIKNFPLTLRSRVFPYLHNPRSSLRFCISFPSNKKLWLS